MCVTKFEDVSRIGKFDYVLTIQIPKVPFVQPFSEIYLDHLPGTSGHKEYFSIIGFSCLNEISVEKSCRYKQINMSMNQENEQCISNTKITSIAVLNK